MLGGLPVSGVQLNFTVVKSNGTLATMSAVTGSNGSATVKYRLNKKDPSGTYQDKAATIVNGSSGSGATTFVVGKGYTKMTVTTAVKEPSTPVSRSLTGKIRSLEDLMPASLRQ
jgi:hypothetical protein